MPESVSTHDLQQECDLLRDHLARLIARRTQLIETEAPAIEARYCELLGALQLRALTAECNVRRLRRRIELIRASHNRGELPDMASIELLLDAELSNWTECIEREEERLRYARGWLETPLLTPRATNELRNLFRDVARRCHPDANPSGGDLASTLWHAANDAYRTGDLPRLRTVALLSRAVPDGGIATEELRQRRRDLLDALSRLQAEIDDILTSFPLSLRPLLEDPEWLKAQQNAAMERLASLEDCRLLLEAELAVLIRESSDV